MWADTQTHYANTWLHCTYMSWHSNSLCKHLISLYSHYVGVTLALVSVDTMSCVAVDHKKITWVLNPYVAGDMIKLVGCKNLCVAGDTFKLLCASGTPSNFFVPVWHKEDKGKCERVSSASVVVGGCILSDAAWREAKPHFSHEQRSHVRWFSPLIGQSEASVVWGYTCKLWCFQDKEMQLQAN